MTDRSPIAFLSYVRSDDAHDNGKITRFRERLEGEVRMHTGHVFPIFQDRNDIAWGQTWDARIKKSLVDVTFLIPIITPSFFESPACREEFETFALREKTLGVSNLILPLYYVDSEQMSPGYKVGSDKIADILRSRQWTDWRNLRFKSYDEEVVSTELSKMAGTIKSAMRDLNSVFEAAAAAPSKARKSRKPELEPREERVEVKARRSIPKLTPVDIKIPEARPRGGFSLERLELAQSRPYFVYTKQYDETISAKSLLSDSEAARYYDYVAGSTKVLSSNYGEDIESFKKYIETFEESVAIMFLIDNSGSMRGKNILSAAAWMSIVLESMDRDNIKTEVVGYTTKTWKGGQSRELWHKDGRPSNPGRLNDVRYIVYKNFDETVRESIPNVCGMTKEGILKENIDGEALIAAYNRLERIDASRKALVVLSDGAPVDDSTLSSNKEYLLHDHMLAATRWIEQQKIYLGGVGIAYDVSRYFNHSSVALPAEDLGPAIFSIVREALSKTAEGNT